MRPFIKFIFCFIAINLCNQLLQAQSNSSGSALQILDSGLISSNAPFESCHASTLVELPGKKIMAAWFGGKHEGSGDVAIWMAVNEKGKWNKPKEIANGLQTDGARLACWNPVLYRTRNGLLFLHYKVGSSPRGWWAVVKSSADNGNTWSPARKLPNGFLGPIKNKPIQLKNGDILYPSSIESENDNTWRVHLEKSDSIGNNWQRIEIDCDSFNVIQPTLLQYSGDTLQMLCRSRQNVIAESWSYDEGIHWEKMSAGSLPNPNSGIDAVSLGNGKHLLVYNPLLAGKDWWMGRSVLKIAVSLNGHEWQDMLTLENHTEGEYSYPAIIQSKDGEIHITYTYDRKNIKYIRCKLN